MAMQPVQVSDPYIFPRTQTPRPAPGEWKPLWDHDHWSATICCPSCKQESILTEHTIQPHGLVEPSIVCPATTGDVECPSCGFHVRAMLAGWPPTDAKIPETLHRV
jgi:hypothetical protein